MADLFASLRNAEQFVNRQRREQRNHANAIGELDDRQRLGRCRQLTTHSACLAASAHDTASTDDAIVLGSMRGDVLEVVAQPPELALADEVNRRRRQSPDRPRARAARACLRDRAGGS